MFEEKESK